MPRALMLGRNTLDVIHVTTFSGVWNTIVPALVILVALDLALGAIAVRALNRASSSAAQ